MSNENKYMQDPRPYERTMGSYKPSFRGKPQDYWQSTPFDILSAIGAMLFLIGLFLALTVLIVNWSFYYGTYSYSLTSSILTCIFIVTFILLNFCLSRGKRRKQHQIMKQAIEKFRNSLSVQGKAVQLELRKSGSKAWINETNARLR